MEKGRLKMQNDSNILVKQFIQKIQQEDFCFLIGKFKIKITSQKLTISS